MNNLKQNLYITYSNQKVRDLKRQNILKPLDKVITLDCLTYSICKGQFLLKIIFKLIKWINQ